MNVIVRMRYGPHAQRPATAWLLHGGDARDWLDELSRWPGALERGRFFLLAAEGLLVLNAAPPGDRAGAHVLPYGDVAGKLYLPVEGRLEPDIEPNEVARLLDERSSVSSILGETTPGTAVHVWHPTLGLCVLEAEAELRASDLLRRPTVLSGDWTAGVPGLALNARLLSLEPSAPLTAASVLEQGRGNIGSTPIKLDDLPRAPGEPAEGLLADWGRAAQKQFLDAMQWLSQQLSGKNGGRAGAGSGTAGSGKEGAGGGGWMSWLARAAQQANESIEQARNRELLRLMKLLEDNPDEGLKYALPMGGGAHRGIAPAGTRLGPRNVDFNLSGLFGGGPADVWDMSPERQAALLQRYRELAAREIALGRHRKAAYIFAHLVGDVRSAAVTLENGRHYREAAALYEEKLQQPGDAARCFEAGGFWKEALSLYDKLGEHEKAGDLHAKLEQHEEAEAAWRRAVTQRVQTHNILAAAALLDKKLRATDEALTLLIDAWPGAPQASACLTAAFAILKSHNRHGEAEQLIGDLPDLRPTAARRKDLVLLLAAQAVSYPLPSVRELAAFQTRVVAAARLAELEPTDSESQAIVQAVTSLVPEDRLLTRDGQRYLSPAKRVPVRTPPVPQGLPSLPLVKEVPLRDYEVGAAVVSEHGAMICLMGDRELALTLVDWNGEFPVTFYGVSESWRVEPGRRESPIAMNATRDSVHMHVIGTHPIPACPIDVRGRDGRAFRAGGHPALSPSTFAFWAENDDVLHTLDWAGEQTLVLNSYLSPQVQLSGVLTLRVPELPGAVDQFQLPLPVVSRGGTVCVGIGCNLVFLHEQKRVSVLETPSNVREIVTSAPFTRTRIAVALEEGGLMLWGASPEADATRFGHGLDRPRIALCRDGTLVAASATGIELYRTANGELSKPERYEGTGRDPIAVLASPRSAKRIAIVHADHRVTLHDVP